MKSGDFTHRPGKGAASVNERNGDFATVIIGQQLWEALAMNDVLPPDVLQGAMIRGNEYGWSVSSFPDALANAESHGYGCLGGQFQFRLDHGGTCEMYWLAADSTDRTDGESWAEYSKRSCSQVLTKFQHLVSVTDFTNEASNWPVKIDPAKSLVFVAYFVTEAELAELRNA